jgi:iron(III) transport system permease protein
VLLPLLVLIKASFQVYPTPYFRAFTLANWGAFFGNDEVVKALLRSFYLSTFGATLTVILRPWSRTSFIAREFRDVAFLSTSLLPIGTPGIVMGLGIMWAYITWPLWGTVWILVLAYMTLLCRMACAQWAPRSSKFIPSLRSRAVCIEVPG